MRKLLAAGIIFLFVVSMFAITISSAAADPDNDVSTRPIQDFIDAQGTYNGLFLSWINNEYTVECSVDYAGLDNEAIIAGGGDDLGTTFSGSVTERALGDGTTLVHVTLHTRNALARSIDWTIGDYIFGSTVAEVLAGGHASLGSCKLSITYITSADPGDPMPDIWEMIFVGIPGTYPTKVNFVATSKGELKREFGVPQGTPGMLSCVIEANFNAPGMWNNHQQMPWSWPASTVNVKQIGN